MNTLDDMLKPRDYMLLTTDEFLQAMDFACEQTEHGSASKALDQLLKYKFVPKHCSRIYAAVCGHVANVVAKQQENS